MTDAGGVPPNQEQATVERARLLRQIAVALEIPGTAFTCVPSAGVGEEPSREECAAILAAFGRIRDPRMRAFCLRMLESLAERGKA